jgi:hypothetical protein
VTELDDLSKVHRVPERLDLSPSQDKQLDLITVPQLHLCLHPPPEQSLCILLASDRVHLIVQRRREPVEVLRHERPAPDVLPPQSVAERRVLERCGELQDVDEELDWEAVEHGRREESAKAKGGERRRGRFESCVQGAYRQAR